MSFTQSLRSRFLLIGCVAFGAVSLQAATPILLVPNAATPVGTPSTIDDGTVVFSHLQGFSDGGMTGQLGVTVLSGVSANPNSGGLTFVYELANLTPDPDKDTDPFNDEDPELGVLNWVVGPFDLNTTWFELGSSFFFAPNDTPVLPEFANMDGAGIVTVTYPPGEGAPPVFHEENTWQMIFYTNASSWVWTDTSMYSYKTDQSVYWTIEGVATVTPTRAVPDGGEILLPLALVLIALGLLHRRRR